MQAPVYNFDLHFLLVSGLAFPMTSKARGGKYMLLLC